VLTDNIQKEDFSIAYISAVCAQGKMALDISRHDEDGVDAIIRKAVMINGKPIKSIIGVQLKSTTIKGVKEVGDDYLYKFKAKNYNDLVSDQSYPQFLMLLVLPEERDDWFFQSDEQMRLKKCMYYKDFFNLKETNNTSTVSILISKKNICTADNIEKLMIEYEKGYIK
jgi:hypothetical protein